MASCRSAAAITLTRRILELCSAHIKSLVPGSGDLGQVDENAAVLDMGREPLDEPPREALIVAQASPSLNMEA